MRAAVALSAAAVAVAVTLAVVATRERGAAAQSAPIVPTAEAPPPAAAPTPAPAAADATAREPGDAGAGLLELPDGTTVPALNGAVGAPPLADSWGTRPWSPIAGVERSDRGLEWYVHADGTRTTTEMRWRPDLGRYDAMTRIAQPQAGTPPVGAAR